jgi:hypothetical protein
VLAGMKKPRNFDKESRGFLDTPDRSRAVRG